MEKSAKWRNKSRDRISQLPDEILVSVLSHFPFKNGMATSVLSSRWMGLWKFSCRLDFDASRALEVLELECDSHLPARHKLGNWIRSLKMVRESYVEWVNHVMNSHLSMKLEEFRIHFDLTKDNQKDITDWLIFALARRVERLELDLSPCLGNFNEFIEVYDLPSELLGYNISSSQASDYNHCSFYSSLVIGFKSLKSLCFASVNVTGDVLEYFLSSCPVLERLILRGCKRLAKFKVSGSSLMLKYLEIRSCYQLTSINICETNLMSLRYFGKKEYISLSNLALLTEVSFGYMESAKDVIPVLSSVLSQLEIFALTTMNAKATSELQEFPELSRLKQLELTVDTWNETNLMEVSSLVVASPQLQKFVLQVETYMLGCNNRYMWWPKGCPLPNLKVVEFAGYSGGTTDLEIVMYFLKNASALEELIIDPRFQLFLNSRKHEDIVKMEDFARTHAVENLVGNVPEHVRLSIL